MQFRNMLVEGRVPYVKKLHLLHRQCQGQLEVKIVIPNVFPLLS